MKTYRIIAALLMSMLVTSCAVALKPNTISQETSTSHASIVAFNYVFGTSSVNTNYEILLDDGEINFSAHKFNCGEYELELEESVGKDVLSSLESILTKYPVFSWDGFNSKSTMQTPGGYFFAMKIQYSNGTTISVEGESTFPEQFESASKEIQLYLEEYIEDLMK